MKGHYTLTMLKQWSCKAKNINIPGIGSIKAIHVYDFDNTLFSSPLPNTQLWHPGTLGFLQTYEAFAHGGWWHDPSILAATGEGIEIEEPRAWKGWWNEVVLQLAEASIQQKDVLTVLMTGRGEKNFRELINKILESRKLNFDLVVLKPERGPSQQTFSSTLEFKNEVFKDLIFTYKHAEEIKVYEDRVRHVKSFREYFDKLNKSLLSHPADQPPPERKPIIVDVVHVCELKSSLSPETETIAIQRAINRHNDVVKHGGPNPNHALERLLHIKENFVYFGYLISQHDSARLITLCNTQPHLIDSGEVKLMASNILIAPFYPRKDILEKVGGRGKKVTWQVNGIAKLEDRIWAARVAPVTETQIWTQDPTPLVVLAVRKGARPIDAAKIQNWQPVAPEKQFIFETVVGDRVMLKVEEIDEESNQNNHRPGRHHNNNKRKFGHEDEQSKGPNDNKENSNFSHNTNSNNNGGNNGNSGRQGHGKYFSGKREQFSNRRGNNNNGNNNSNAHQRRNNNHNHNNNNNPNPNDQSGGYESGAGRGNARRQGGGQNQGGGRFRQNKQNGPPANYKSLDDYGPAGFDGSGDQANGSGGAMVMNY